MYSAKGRTLEVAVDVSPVFVTYFACNRGPVLGNPDSRQVPDYGVTASLDRASINLTLTFRTGSAYCCCQWGCHLNLYAGQRWQWLRRELSACGWLHAERLQLHLTVIVEPGALFFDWSKPDPTRRSWYGFAPGDAQQYDVIIEEGEPKRPAIRCS
jgi:hypothetical protein